MKCYEENRNEENFELIWRISNAYSAKITLCYFFYFVETEDCQIFAWNVEKPLLIFYLTIFSEITNGQLKIERLWIRKTFIKNKVYFTFQNNRNGYSLKNWINVFFQGKCRSAHFLSLEWLKISYDWAHFHNPKSMKPAKNSKQLIWTEMAPLKKMNSIHTSASPKILISNPSVAFPS